MSIENSSSDQLTLKDFISILKDWRKIIIKNYRKILVFGFLLSFLFFSYAMFSKPRYNAILTFVLEEEKGGGSGALGGALGLASQFGIDLGAGGGGPFSIANITELMKSRMLLEKTLLTTVKINDSYKTLADIYIDFMQYQKNWPSRLKNINFKPGMDRANFSLQQDSLLKVFSNEILENNLTVKQIDKKVTIITVIFSSKNEIFSKLFCENLINETSKFYIETKSKKARLNVEILQKQTDSIRSELNNAMSGVAYATDNIYNLNPSLNIKSIPSKKRQIDVQANTEILKQLVAQLELSKVALRKETPLIQKIDTPNLPLNKEKFGKLIGLISGFLSGVFLSSIYFITKKAYLSAIS